LFLEVRALRTIPAERTDSERRRRRARQRCFARQLLAGYRLSLYGMGSPGSDEAVSLGREAGRKRIPTINGALIKQGDSIMWAIILNSVYRQFLRSSLSGMRKFAAG
jgi:hypothetical protein